MFSFRSLEKKRMAERNPWKMHLLMTNNFVFWRGISYNTLGILLKCLLNRKEHRKLTTNLPNNQHIFFLRSPFYSLPRKFTVYVAVNGVTEWSPSENCYGTVTSQQAVQSDDVE